MQNRILQTADDPNIRHIYVQVLESEHYEVIIAKAGRQRTEVCLRSGLDLVLPDKDEWKTLSLIRKIPPRLPVFILTARPYQLEKGAEMGVNARMVKPLDLSQLLNTIREALEKPTAGMVAATGVERYDSIFNRQLKKLH